MSDLNKTIKDMLQEQYAGGGVYTGRATGIRVPQTRGSSIPGGAATSGAYTTPTIPGTQPAASDAGIVSSIIQGIAGTPDTPSRQYSTSSNVRSKWKEASKVETPKDIPHIDSVPSSVSSPIQVPKEEEDIDIAQPTKSEPPKDITPSDISSSSVLMSNVPSLSLNPASSLSNILKLGSLNYLSSQPSNPQPQVSPQSKTSVGQTVQNIVNLASNNQGNNMSTGQQSGPPTGKGKPEEPEDWWNEKAKRERTFALDTVSRKLASFESPGIAQSTQSHSKFSSPHQGEQTPAHDRFRVSRAFVVPREDQMNFRTENFDKTLNMLVSDKIREKINEMIKSKA